MSNNTVNYKIRWQKFYQKIKAKRQIFSLVIVFVAVGYLTGALTHAWDKNHSFPEPSLTRTYLQNTKYKFIKPALVSEVGEKKEFKEYKPLEGKLNSIIDQAKNQNQANDVGVYFRDIELGRWTGINEETPFSPGSLLKVPLMIAYFSEAQEEPSILEKKILFEQKDKVGNIQAIEPEESIKSGQSYPVSELIRRMIVYSDNDATNLLYDNIDHNALSEVFSDLGLTFDKKTAASDFISPKSYSLFFRVLYNSSYLSRSYSESALELLSQTNFKDGITAGEPDGIVIAHKFGERELVYADTNTQAVELHDCGIVYYQDHPYVLCVMTRGKNLKDLEQIIKNISAAVYETVADKYH